MRVLRSFRWNDISGSSLEQQLATGHDLPAIRPLAEKSIMAAIASLEASTYAIEKHVEVIKSQSKYLESLREQTRPADQSGREREIGTDRKAALELQHLGFEVCIEVLS